MSLVKKVKKYNVYSEGLKVEVVREIEGGNRAVSEVSRYYGIPVTTIADWVRKYGKYKYRREKVEIVMKDQADKIRELESALADAHLKLKIQDKMLELGKEEYGLEIKKNCETGQYEAVKGKGKVSKGAVK